jgi:hypothetical protein
MTLIGIGNIGTPGHRPLVGYHGFSAGALNLQLRQKFRNWFHWTAQHSENGMCKIFCADMWVVLDDLECRLKNNLDWTTPPLPGAGVPSFAPFENSCS